MDVRIKACVVCVCVLWDLCCSGQGLCGVLRPVSAPPPVCSCVLDQFVLLTTNLSFFFLVLFVSLIDCNIQTRTAKFPLRYEAQKQRGYALEVKVSGNKILIPKL